MKRNSTRREFLTTSIQSLGAIGLSSNAIATLLNSVYSRAFAQSVVPTIKLNENGYRYVFVSLSGAPPRWMFDMLPTPNGSSDSYMAGGFGNAFDISGTSVTAVNRTFQYSYGSGKKLYLPPVWGYSPAGVDFTSILPHTFFIRGMDMEINDHAISNARQVAPITNGKSIHGVIADQMGSPVASVNNNALSGGAFRSEKGLGTVTVSIGATTNPIGILTAPFKSILATNSYRAENIKPVVDQFLDRLDSYATAHRIPQSSLRSAQDAADDLIRLNIDQLTSTWDTYLNRYETVVNASLQPNKGELPGVYDKAIPTSEGGNKYKYDINQPTKVINLSDARDMLTGGVNKLEIARYFALTEFLLTTGISSTVDINVAGTVLNNATVSSDLQTKSFILADQHGVGIVPSILATTIFYRGLLSALTELVTALKNKQLFKKTIIHVSSEFNRNPRADNSGSDHGVGGGSATLISGMLNEVDFVGNILTAGSGTGSPGTWGHAANWTFEDGVKRPIKVNDVARTITSMTNSADIVSNGYALLKPSGAGLWIAKKSGGSNV